MKYLKRFESSTSKYKYFTLDWMSNKRKYFDSEIDMLKYFNERKKEAIDNNEEL